MFAGTNWASSTGKSAARYRRTASRLVGCQGSLNQSEYNRSELALAALGDVQRVAEELLIRDAEVGTRKKAADGV